MATCGKCPSKEQRERELEAEKARLAADKAGQIDLHAVVHYAPALARKGKLPDSGQCADPSTCYRRTIFFRNLAVAFAAHTCRSARQEKAQDKAAEMDALRAKRTLAAA